MGQGYDVRKWFGTVEEVRHERGPAAAEPDEIVVAVTLPSAGRVHYRIGGPGAADARGDDLR